VSKSSTSTGTGSSKSRTDNIEDIEACPVDPTAPSEVGCKKVNPPQIVIPLPTQYSQKLAHGGNATLCHNAELKAAAIRVLNKHIWRYLKWIELTPKFREVGGGNYLTFLNATRSSEPGLSHYLQSQENCEKYWKITLKAIPKTLSGRRSNVTTAIKRMFESK